VKINKYSSAAVANSSTAAVFDVDVALIEMRMFIATFSYYMDLYIKDNKNN